MNKERKFFGTHIQRLWYLEDIEIPEIEGIDFVITMYGTFYVVSTCYEGHYHVGTTSYFPQEDLNASLTKLVYEDKVYSPWFKGVKKAGECSCVINLLSPIKEPCKDNVLFVGDSTWVMEVTNAAAILFGWKAANAVTLALLDGKINKEGISSY